LRLPHRSRSRSCIVGSGRVLLHPSCETETKAGIGCETMHSCKRGATWGCGHRPSFSPPAYAAGAADFFRDETSVSKVARWSREIRHMKAFAAALGGHVIVIVRSSSARCHQLFFCDFASESQCVAAGQARFLSLGPVGRPVPHRSNWPMLAAISCCEQRLRPCADRGRNSRAQWPA
jgi:hypothetical protein